MGEDDLTAMAITAGASRVASGPLYLHAVANTPAGPMGSFAPATRESQAGPSGVTERPVVLRKPGNAGGGKGPQLKGDATSDEGPRD
jgi:hypothetical protein